MSDKYTSGRDVFNEIYEIKENDFIEGVRLLSRSSGFSFENKGAILNKNIPTTLLSPSGKVFDVDIFDIHEDFIFNVFVTIFENKSDIDIYEVASEFNIDIDDLSSSAYEHVTNNLGFITLNTGDGFGDDRCKAVIHKRPTQQQINLLRDWLELRVEERKPIIVFAGASFLGVQKTYEEDDENYDADLIVRSIQRSFITNFLENNSKNKNEIWNIASRGYGHNYDTTSKEMLLNKISNYVGYSVKEDDISLLRDVANISGDEELIGYIDFYEKQFLDESLKESDERKRVPTVYLYRGTSERSFSKHYEKFSGLFFGIKRKYVTGWGNVKRYTLDKNAKIFEGKSSDEFCGPYYDRVYPELNKYFGMYFPGVKKLNDFINLPQEKRDEIEKNVNRIAGDKFCWYDVWTWCLQAVAKIELSKQGYDGAKWTEEDWGNPVQYQIWNLNVVHSNDNVVESDYNNKINKDSDKDIDENDYIVESMSNKEKEVIDTLDKYFGQKEPYVWSTYILPNGHFLNPENYKKDDAEWQNSLSYEHEDFYFVLDELGYVGDEVFEDYCIKVNVTYPYVAMPNNRPTPEQFLALRKLIDRRDEFEYSFDEISDIVENGSDVYDMTAPLIIILKNSEIAVDLDSTDGHSIVKMISRAYTTGTLLAESALNESKADQQKFIDKFGEQRWTLFNKLKARLVNKDIYYWLKKTEDELDDELRRIASQKTNKEVRNEAKRGATLIDEDENWKVYRIDTYEASKYYGYGTQWCISSADNAVNIFNIYGETSEEAIQDLKDFYPVVKVLSIYNLNNNYWEIEAELDPYYYFNEYSENSNIYFFIAKPENEECFESDRWCKVAYVAETDTFYDAKDMGYDSRDNGSNFSALPQSLQDFFKKRRGLLENLNESKDELLDTLYSTIDSNINEAVKTNHFTPYTAGYILEDGSLLVMDEYHGEEEIREFYPEYSNTHPEEDTCVRLYIRPTEAQYRRLEEIIDYYLDHEGYCKVEIWEKFSGKYNFYEVYSLYEGACEDPTWNEKIGNWTGYKLVQIIKNYFAKRVIERTIKKSAEYYTSDEKLEESSVDEKLSIPKYLYHATYKPFLKSIKEKGLGNTRKKMWSDSVRGVVYLATDEDVAYSYAENAEWLDDVEDYDKYADNIVILKIDTDKLDKTKFKKDSNVIDGDDTFEYHGVIPFEFVEEILDKHHIGESLTR